MVISYSELASTSDKFRNSLSLCDEYMMSMSLKTYLCCELLLLTLNFDLVLAGLEVDGHLVQQSGQHQRQVS